MPQTPVYFYSSASGLVRRFATHLERPVFDLADPAVRNSEADGPWVLLTPSYKAGSSRGDTLPKAVLVFLASPVNRRRMVGVIGSGNRNFGVHYQAAARQIAARSGRPMLFEFELSGTPEDVACCREILSDLDAALTARHARPQRAASEQGDPEQAPPEQTAPEQATPEQTAPEQGGPGEERR